MQREYLISHEEKTFFCCKSNYILNALSALHLTCGTAQSLWRNSLKWWYAVMLFCCHLVGLLWTVHAICGYKTTAKGGWFRTRHVRKPCPTPSPTFPISVCANYLINIYKTFFLNIEVFFYLSVKEIWLNKWTNIYNSVFYGLPWPSLLRCHQITTTENQS